MFSSQWQCTLYILNQYNLYQILQIRHFRQRDDESSVQFMFHTLCYSSNITIYFKASLRRQVRNSINSLIINMKATSAFVNYCVKCWNCLTFVFCLLILCKCFSSGGSNQLITSSCSYGLSNNYLNYMKECSQF